MSSSKVRISKMGKYTVACLGLLLVGTAIVVQSPDSLFGVFRDLGAVGLIVPVCYYAFRVIVRLKRRLLWKVRNKIILSYAFVGILPVLLLALISWLTLRMIFQQLSAVYLQTELQNIASLLEDTNDSIILDYYRAGRSRREVARSLRSYARTVLADFPRELDNAFFRLHRITPSANETLYRVGADRTEATASDGTLRSRDRIDLSWLQGSFTGITESSRGLSFCSFVELMDDSGRFILETSLPFDEELRAYIERRTGMKLGVAQVESDLSSFIDESKDFLSVRAAHVVKPLKLNDGSAGPDSRILLSIPIPYLVNHFFSSAGVMVGIAVGLIALFLMVEASALIIGIAIARSITVSVHNIYTGAQKIQSGAFGFQIPSRNRDQLDEMANSFNRMSAGINKLMLEVARKEWLEKEIEIATQVQKQLFPRVLPSTRRLQIAASCVPARQVSGDYYDFIPYGEAGLDVIVGDISGKGISAALMMASTQSSIRNQLLSLPVDSERRVARTVLQVSRQLYRNSPPNAYSTLVLGHFEADAGEFTYCNGGHCYPLLVSANGVANLTAGGPVVGLIDHSDYEEATVKVDSGDLLVFYTDGVLEAENHNEEQFGEQRLVDLIRSNTFLTAQDIHDLIIGEVFQWAGSAEQADDITVVCLKVE